MTTLHEALQCLKPTSWDDVPQDADGLRSYLREMFKNGRLIAESLPDPPLSESTSYPGLEHDRSDSSTRRLIPSSSRVGETDPEVTDLQKAWGKPIKMGGPKDNPVDVTVWKLSANDGGGSWFGRRSVHEGLPFSRWRQKLSTEYDETLKVNQKKLKKGQTPDNSIRGIGAEEKIETIEIKDDDGSVLGGLSVYHVSAQFPRPTTPRDFVALIINSDRGLEIGGTKQPGRSWMMISKPCDHAGIPPKQGYTRGEYESVEIIREIPKKKHGSSSSSSGRGSNKSLTPNQQRPQQDGARDEDEEMNPVEWIMVTRSDPGGNIPRWMVDKGTPKSVGTDAAKFINWAIQDNKPPKQPSPDTEPTNGSGKPEQSQSVDGSDSDKTDSSDSDYESADSDGEHSHHGLIASVTGLLNTGLERLAPQVLGYGNHSEPPKSPPDAEEVSYIDPEGVAHLSPESARQNKTSSDTVSSKSPQPDQCSLSSAISDQPTPAINEGPPNDLTPEEMIQMTKNGKPSSYEKELAKLAIRKREVEAKLEEVRAELDNLQISSRPPTAPGTPPRNIGDDASGMRKRAATNASSPASSRTQQSQLQIQNEGANDSQTSLHTATPGQAGLQKLRSQLLSGEAKLVKQLRKLEASQSKVASKIQTKQRKDEERSEKHKSKKKSEVEGLKQEVSDLKKEVKTLRGERQKWIDLVTSLQAENTKLAAKSDGA
ncbi:uncharacterized protein N7515_006943 [Penicillium bovifimosum]|uniref:DUF3074 domain-containing protein n=1 Tax=Penicillium bovifimosum TaxID=126998 RepID=A0A9W9GVM7_9EURO|nr:uncharacterized protein N7515_006943 [Penicillium bovifimosum]KAJ5130904.1 hypothetical protein N7515_006943 [Penicillium bovifimosum]